MKRRAGGTLFRTTLTYGLDFTRGERREILRCAPFAESPGAGRKTTQDEGDADGNDVHPARLFLKSLRADDLPCVRRRLRPNLVAVAQPLPWREFRMSTPEQDSTPGSTLSITARLEASTGELHELEELVKTGKLDSRVLAEFRNAVDHIRNTTWAVQKWIGLSDQSGGDPFSVLPIMSAERVKRATQISSDLSLDLQSIEVGIDTPGIVDLFNAVDDLHRRLTALLKHET